MLTVRESIPRNTLESYLQCITPAPALKMSLSTGAARREQQKALEAHEQMWQERAPVPVQMWQERAPVPAKMWQG